MSIRIGLAATVVLLAGCGGAGEPREVRLLAPVGEVDSAGRFERETGCRVDARIYDPDEDVVAIARRRDVDAVAGTASTLERLRVAGEELTAATALRPREVVAVTLEGSVTVTVPRELAPAFAADATSTRPAGRRVVGWAIRGEGDNAECARRWIAYVSRSSK